MRQVTHEAVPDGAGTPQAVYEDQRRGELGALSGDGVDFEVADLSAHVRFSQKRKGLPGCGRPLVEPEGSCLKGREKLWSVNDLARKTYYFFFLLAAFFLAAFFFAGFAFFLAGIRNLLLESIGA
jgi:hypothetical protein